MDENNKAGLIITKTITKLNPAGKVAAG